MDILKTTDSDINLVPPDVDRDAPESVKWLAGAVGHETMRLMGNTEENSQSSTLKDEEIRIQELINSAEQLKWTIMHENRPVGFVWVDLNPSDSLPAPSIHIIIGDKQSRGHGIGGIISRTVIDELKTNNEYSSLYSRHLKRNRAATDLLTGLGFENFGEEYKDGDGLIWQNVKLELSDN